MGSALTLLSVIEPNIKIQLTCRKWLLVGRAEHTAVASCTTRSHWAGFALSP